MAQTIFTEGQKAGQTPLSSLGELWKDGRTQAKTILSTLQKAKRNVTIDTHRIRISFGELRVISERFRKTVNEFDNDFRLVLLDRNGEPLLNIATTNQRSIDVTWRRDEKAIIVHNRNANTGDYLVYISMVKPEIWKVLRHSTEEIPFYKRSPNYILNPGRTKYWDFRCKIYSGGFQGDKVLAALWLRASRRRNGKMESASEVRHYVVGERDITTFPTPHQIRSLEAALNWD